MSTTAPPRPGSSPLAYRASCQPPGHSAYQRWGHLVLEFGLLVPSLLMAAPLGLLIALCNWIQFRDARLILFSQLRVGKDGRSFRIFKFRTLIPAGHTPFNSWHDGTDNEHATRLGAWLRRTHMDELPQLINVIRGEMRIIGPRPESEEIETWVRSQVPEFSRRQVVLPGMTGHAQVHMGYVGADIAAYSMKLKADLIWVAERTLRRDLAILLRTVAAVLRLRGGIAANSEGNGGGGRLVRQSPPAGFRTRPEIQTSEPTEGRRPQQASSPLMAMEGTGEGRESA